MFTIQSDEKWIKKEHAGAFMHNKVVVLAFATTDYLEFKEQDPLPWEERGF